MPRVSMKKFLASPMSIFLAFISILEICFLLVIYPHFDSCNLEAIRNPLEDGILKLNLILIYFFGLVIIGGLVEVFNGSRPFKTLSGNYEIETLFIDPARPYRDYPQLTSTACLLFLLAMASVFRYDFENTNDLVIINDRLTRSEYVQKVAPCNREPNVAPEAVEPER